MDEIIHKDLLDIIEEKMNIKSEEIFAVARSVAQTGLDDENTIRNLVQMLSTLANIPVSEEVEDSIVDSFISQDLPMKFEGSNKKWEG